MYSITIVNISRVYQKAPIYCYECEARVKNIVSILVLSWNINRIYFENEFDILYIVLYISFNQYEQVKPDQKIARLKHIIEYTGN